MNNIIIMGLPGAGKGTACAHLVEKYGYEHISTGDLLRKEQEKGSVIGKKASGINAGNYVPDELVIAMVKEHIINSTNKVGFLFDGFPRTKEQVKQIHAFLIQRKMPVSTVLFLEVDENEAIERIIERGKKKGRPDDTPEVIRKRLAEYYQNTAPVVDFFEKKGLLKRVSSTNGIDIMCENVVAAINQVVV